MANATVCSVEGCDRDARSRGWCPGHYHRWVTKGDVGSPTFRARSSIRENMPTATAAEDQCAVEVCDASIAGRLGRSGWCKAHYSRWLATGDPGNTPINRKRPSRGCSVEGCGRKHSRQGFCQPHYRRVQETGDPGGLEFYRPAEVPTYYAVHQRLRVAFGPAREHRCPCGRQATAWAYQYNDPDFLVAENGSLYSTNLDCYSPLCTRCHKTYDNGQRANVRRVMAMAPGGFY